MGITFKTDEVIRDTEQNTVLKKIGDTVEILGGGTSGALQSINDKSSKKYETKNVRTYLNTDNKVYIMLASEPQFDKVTITTDQVGNLPSDQDLVSYKLLKNQNIKIDSDSSVEKTISLNSKLSFLTSESFTHSKEEYNGNNIKTLTKAGSNDVYIGIKEVPTFKKVKISEDQTSDTVDDQDLITKKYLDSKIGGEVAKSNDKAVSGDKIYTAIVGAKTKLSAETNQNILKVSKSESDNLNANTYTISLNKDNLVNSIKDTSVSTAENKFPTSKAVKDYVDGKLNDVSVSLNYDADNSSKQSLSLKNGTLKISGKTSEIKTEAKTGGEIVVGLDSAITTKIDNKLEKDLSNISDNGKTAITNLISLEKDNTSSNAISISNEVGSSKEKKFKIKLDENQLVGNIKTDTINDTNKAKLTTGDAVKNYVDGKISSLSNSLTFKDGNNSTGSVDLKTKQLEIKGEDGIETKAQNQSLTISLNKTTKDLINSISSKADSSDLNDLKNKGLTIITNEKSMGALDISKKLGESLDILGGNSGLVSFNDNKAVTFETKNIRTYTNTDGKIYITLAESPEFKKVKILEDQTTSAPNAKDLISKEYLESRIGGNIENTNTDKAVNGNKIYSAILNAKTKVSLKNGESILEINPTENINNLDSNKYELSLNTTNLFNAFKDDSVSENVNKFPTSKAVNDFITNKLQNYSSVLKYTANSGGEKSIKLNEKALNFKGKENEINTTSKEDGIVEFALDNSIKSKIDNLSANTKGDIESIKNSKITFKTDLKDKNTNTSDISKKLGETLEILAGKGGLSSFIDEKSEKFETKNIRTFTNNDAKIYITLSSKPIFENVSLDKEQTSAADNDLISKKYFDTKQHKYELIKDSNSSSSLSVETEKQNDKTTFKVSLNETSLFDNLKSESIKGLSNKFATDKAVKDYVEENLGSQVIKYKANGKDEKSVKLSEGFNFSDGKNIEALVEDSGVVKFNLKDELESIKKISGGDNNKSNISFDNKNIFLESDGAKLSIEKDDSAIKLSGLAERNVDTQDYGQDGRAATEKAVKDIATKLGLVKADKKQSSSGISLKDGQDGKSIVEKVESIRNGLAGNVVYTTDSGERLTEESGKYYVVKDGKKEEVSADKVSLSLVDPKGDTTKAIKLNNIASYLVDDKKLLEDNSNKVVEKLLSLEKDSLNKGANLADLKAIAKAGLDFGTNKNNEIVHKNLGSIIEIIGRDEKISDFGSFSSENIATNINSGKIIIGISKNPKFENIYLTSEKGNILDESYAKDINASLAVRRSEIKDLVEKGIIIKTQDNKEFTVKLGGTLNIVGSNNTSTTISKSNDDLNNNIVTNTKNDKVVVKISDNPKFESVNIKDIEISSDDNKLILKAENEKSVVLSNISAGKEDSDAVNYGQLKKLSETSVKYDDESKTNITLGDVENKNGVRIQNVADGINEKDAINKGQLDKVYKESLGGIASAMAMATIPQTIDKTKPYTIGAATAIYKGEGAVAVGISGVNKNGNFIFKANSSLNTTLDLGASVGISYAFGKNKQQDKANLDNDLSSYISNMEKDLSELRKYKENAELKLAENDARIKASEDKLKQLEDKLLKLLGENKNEIPEILKCVTQDKRCIVGDFEIAKTDVINKEEIKELVRVLNENVKSGVIDVIGHTDNTGEFAYNMDLGLKRATEVVKLLKKYGLKKDVVFRNITSSGKIAPLNSNENIAQKLQNRRVEIHFDNVEYK